LRGILSYLRQQRAPSKFGAAQTAHEVRPSNVLSADVRKWHRSDLVRGGRAVPLCPGRSDVDLFRDGESVVDLNPQIAHGALDLLVAQQKLDRPQIASATVYECRFGSAQ
jgi:hypothetical protein